MSIKSLEKPLFLKKFQEKDLINFNRLASRSMNTELFIIRQQLILPLIWYWKYPRIMIKMIREGKNLINKDFKKIIDKAEHYRCMIKKYLKSTEIELGVLSSLLLLFPVLTEFSFVTYRLKSCGKATILIISLLFICFIHFSCYCFCCYIVFNWYDFFIC